MSTVEITIPQIGEGLQEARLVAVLKQPGDTIKRDEPIYQMETDKAVMDVESPHDGVLDSWLAEVDEVLPIGAAVAKIRLSAGTSAVATEGGAAPASAHAPNSGTSEAGGAKGIIPPRTRAYAKEKGLSEEQLNRLAEGKAKLMPEDIDAHLAGGSGSTSSHGGSAHSGAYAEQPMAAAQRVLSSRLQRGNQLVVQGTMSVVANWEPIESLRNKIKASGDSFQPSAFTLFAYAATQAIKDYPLFHSIVVGSDVVRTYHHVDLGIAVSLPGDELVLAVVDAAETLSWREFAAAAKAAIDLARSGKDQAKESVATNLTNMQAFGLRDAVPVVVSPGVATLYLGEPYYAQVPTSAEPLIGRFVNLALSFDHRLINGVGAAEFLNQVRKNVEGINGLLDS